MTTNERSAIYEYDASESAMIPGETAETHMYDAAEYSFSSEHNRTVTVINPGPARVRNWPSRDPIGEEGGANLYSFVGNSAVTEADFLGWVQWSSLAALGFYYDAAGNVEGSFYKVQADDGTWIGPTAAAAKRVVADWSGDYNCHGYTFDGLSKAPITWTPSPSPGLPPVPPITIYMHVSFQNGAASDVLHHDGWKVICCAAAQAGDIVVFDTGDWSQLDHSGKIVSVTPTTGPGGLMVLNEGASLVANKRGWGNPFMPGDTFAALAAGYGAEYTCFTKAYPPGYLVGPSCCGLGANERPGPASLYP